MHHFTSNKFILAWGGPRDPFLLSQLQRRKGHNPFFKNSWIRLFEQNTSLITKNTEMPMKTILLVRKLSLKLINMKCDTNNTVIKLPLCGLTPALMKTQSSPPYFFKVYNEERTRLILLFSCKLEI